jgi:methylase of polypeptide subunit release factors
MEPRAAGDEIDGEGDQGGMSTTIQQPDATDHTPADTIRRLTAAEIRALDPYHLMAELGKTVIHPGGGRSTEELLAMADPRPGDRVLDAGCGIVTTAAQIARRFNCEVVALDINEANLDRARRTVEQVGVDDRGRSGAATSSNSSSKTRALMW